MTNEVAQEPENRVKKMTPEEIAGKTLQYQSFQLSILIVIAMASFTATFFRDYGPIVAILAGGVIGVFTALIARHEIRKLGFLVED